MSTENGMPTWTRYFDSMEFFQTPLPKDTGTESTSTESLESRQSRINQAHEEIQDAKNKLRDLLTDYQVIVESQILGHYFNIPTRSAFILLAEKNEKINFEVKRIADNRKIILETKPN